MEQIAICFSVISIAVFIYVLFLLALDRVLRSNWARRRMDALSVDPRFRLRNTEHVIVVFPEAPASTDPLCLASAIPTFPYKAPAEGTVRNCPICLGEFEGMDMVGALPRCTHLFHEDCIKLWLHSHSDCPICRARVEPV